MNPWQGCLYFLLATAAAAAASIPSYMKPCQTNDPKLDECVLGNSRNGLKNFIHGDPKNSIPDLEPLFIKEVTFRQGTNQVGLNLVIKDANMYGISKFNIFKASVDLKTRTVEFEMVNEEGIRIVGNYTVSGKVLLLPISGSGKAEIRAVVTNTKVKCGFELVKKKGKEYVKFNDVQITNTLGKTSIKLENLFNGDKLLGDNMNKVLNENSKELGKDFEPAVSEILAKVIKNVMTAMYSHTPFEELYPNK